MIFGEVTGARPFGVITLAALLVGCTPLGGQPAGPGPTAGPGGPAPGAADPGETPGETAAASDVPAPASAPAPASGGRGLSADARALLDLHNRFRADHCAPALAWSDELEAVAQGWANKLRDAGCAFEHSRTRYGENLAMGTSGALTPEVIVGMWYREVDSYDFRRGKFDMATGHFTQLAWVGTTRLGCARAVCGDNDIVVCNYDPPGNVETQFRANVLPTSCKKSK
jgi:pathogenesis-related protein 1